MLQNIQNIEHTSIKDIESLVNQYPYVALYKTLLAKKYKEAKHSDFQEALQRAAIYSPNRKKLYHFINVEEEKKEEKVSKTSLREVEKEAVAEKKIEEKVVLEHEQKQTFEAKETVFHETDDSKEEQEIEKKSEASLSDAVNEEHSFLEWLTFVDGNEEVIKEEDELESQLKRHKASAEYEVQLNDEITSMQGKSEAEKVDLTPAEKEAVNKLAEGSITLTTGVVTETLAKIMLMQGKINDAIAMYRALSLKYPEKSNYFAAQIVKIKKN